jgi:rod shape-determining protein MreD
MLAAFLGLLVLCAAVFQSVIGTALTVAGGRPDLVLLVVLAWAMQRGPSEGIAAGILGGFALDTLSGLPLGVHTSILALIGFSTSLGEVGLYRGNLALFFGAAVLSTVAFHVALALVLQLAGWQPPGLARFAQVTMPTALLNAALMPPVYWVVSRGMRWLYGWRRLEV